MSRHLGHLARFCVAHARTVLIAWLLLIVGVVFLAAQVGTKTATATQIELPGSDSQRAADLLQASFPSQQNGSSQIVFASHDGQLDDPRNAEAIQATLKALRADPDVVSVGPPTPASVSPDGSIGYATVVLKQSPVDVTDTVAENVMAATAPASRAGLQVEAAGVVGGVLSEPRHDSSLAVGLAAALIILLFTFGSVVAMGMPILTALLGLAFGLSCIGLLGHIVDLPASGGGLASMIGLGVGIDYALFILTRHLAGLKEGRDPHDSVVEAVSTSGAAVVFAGATVVIALLSLALTGIPIVAALGYSSALVVGVAVVAAVTLMPAILALLGPRIRALRLPLGHHVHDPKPHGWARWARFISAHPWPAIVVGVLILLVLAIPVRSMNLGSVGPGQDPESATDRRAYDLISEGFGPGVNGPLLVIASLKPAAEDSQALAGVLRSQPGVAAVTGPQTAPTAALFTVIPKTGPSSDRTEQLVRDLRGALASQMPTTAVYVGGSTAFSIDLATKISDRLPLVILIVIGLSALLLLLAFRSLIVPLKAAVMNLLAVGAAFGVVTAVFQQGFGDTLIGLDGSIPLESFVPIMMFVILFGLSMDYEVFLMSNVQEHYRESEDTHAAVIAGLADTGRIITSAALIMFSVFFSFVLSDDPTLKQFGLGLAVAVLIDATVIRCLLVPAVITKLGDRTWWMPGFLERYLPQFSIEGPQTPPPETPPPDEDRLTAKQPA